MAYLYRTADFSSSNADSAVLSMWVKITLNDTVQGLFLGWNDSSNYATCYLNSDNTIYYKEKNGGTQYETRITSSARKFRDNNAWYHLVFQWDYTQASASNRIKVWINGELQTWENSGNLPPQNYSLRLKNSDFRIGDYTHAGNSYSNWKGLMSHVHFIDDATYDTYQASAFGETDATTGEWKIKTSPTISDYGSQGFFILKDGNSVTDQSGNSNNFTVGGGTLTNTEDSPSNVFATLNPLSKSSAVDFSNGNLVTFGNTAATNGNYRSTLYTSSGKFYVEIKCGVIGASNNPRYGIINEIDAGIPSDGATNSVGTVNSSVSYENSGGVYSNDSVILTLTTYTTNDIIAFALDADNGALYVSKNGTWLNSGDPTSGSSKTGAIYTYTAGTVFAFAGSEYNSSTSQFNFGNGYFGTTAVSSAGTNASGNGIFEFDVPTGYTALSTKGLNL